MPDDTVVPGAPQVSEPISADVPDGAPSTGDKPDKPARAPEDYEAEIAKLRRESAGHRTKLRELEPIAKAAQEAEEARKTAEQKANERAEKAERALVEREAGYTRLELAVQYSIPPDDIDLIGSGTRDEMDARAKRLAALHAASMKVAPPPTDRPVEGLRPGATPEPPKKVDNSYPAEWGFISRPAQPN